MNYVCLSNYATESCWKKNMINQFLTALGFNDAAIANLEALGDKEVGAACISDKEWARYFG